MDNETVFYGALGFAINVILLTAMMFSLLLNRSSKPASKFIVAILALAFLEFGSEIPILRVPAIFGTLFGLAGIITSQLKPWYNFKHHGIDAVYVTRQTMLLALFAVPITVFHHSAYAYAAATYTHGNYCEFAVRYIFVQIFAMNMLYMAVPGAVLIFLVAYMISIRTFRTLALYFVERMLVKVFTWYWAWRSGVE